eukprot:gnl/TRDRNA2_/TRDRNA2_205172_c0_seq1.p1 gnl/TRDRNA2_/TRDRNA2_205172_c0~~gnl/TRDRNA2_/TRDRNA2_205172_c0_seq1.p1  ORF type:complete len:300 (+),score=40.19 gnl/TRDRNA2_/TRDRNA2_205172_c0_seq1:25-900(+)
MVGMGTSHQETAEAMEKHGISEVLELIGHGSFSSVYRCVAAEWEQQVVLKVTRKKRPAQYDREAQLLLHAGDHPHLVRLLYVTHEPVQAILLEYCPGGTLHDFLHKNNSCSSCIGLDQRLRAMYEVASAVAFLHAREIIHRDVKASNCFLVDPVTVEPVLLTMPPVKLGDLSLSRSLDGEDDARVMTKLVGTVVYMAPEVLMEESYGPPLDVYSCALLMHQLATSAVPYSGKASASLIIGICNGLRPPLEMLPDDSGELRSLIAECWLAEPRERLSASALCARLRSLCNTN